MCQALLQLVVFVHKRGATRIGHTECVCVETEKLGKGKRPIDVSTSEAAAAHAALDDILLLLLLLPRRALCGI